MKKLKSEEAITILKDMMVDIPVPKAAVIQIKRNAAIEMAIDALKAQADTDTVSRQAARMCLTGDVTNMSIEQYIKMVDKRLEQLPPSPTLSRQHDISKAKFSCPICGAEMEVTVDEWDEGGAV